MKAPPGTSVFRDLAYVEDAHPRQVLDLYIPGTLPAPLPLIVMIHGGGWRQGDKAENAAVAWAAPILLKAGYAVASINHRYSSQALFPAQIHDAKAAVRWLRRNQHAYGLDGTRIGAWGASSGGHLAALLGTSAGVAAMDGALGDASESTRVRAVVAWYAPTDFLQMDAQRLPDGLVHDSPDSPESRLLGGPLQSLRHAARAASPITYASGDDPPFLLLHGDRDRAVPFQQSEMLRDALAAVGVPVRLHILAGAGHGTPSAFLTPDVAELMVGFYDRHVKAR